MMALLLAAIARRDYEEGFRLTKEILQYEPNNAMVLQYRVVLAKQIQQLKESKEEEDDDENEEEEEESTDDKSEDEVEGK